MSRELWHQPDSVCIGGAFVPKGIEEIRKWFA